MSVKPLGDWEPVASAPATVSYESAAIRLQASHKPAGRKHALRIENVLQLPHLCEIRALRPPDVERGFPLRGAPGNCDIAAELAARGGDSLGRGDHTAL